MPNIRERNSRDKIKHRNNGGRQTQKVARLRFIEELRKEFAQNQRDDGHETSEAQAASQMEQATAISVTKAFEQAEQVMERPRRKFQRDAQWKMMRESRQAAKTTAGLFKRAIAATASAAKALISGLTTLLGGVVLVTVFCVVILIAAIIASPFGILLANEPSPGAVTLNDAITQINTELADTLAALQVGDYDSVDIQGQPPNWEEVIAVFACKTAGAWDGVDVAILTPDRLERLRMVFWDMCLLSTEVETILHQDSSPDDEVDDSWTEHILHITITARTAEDMRVIYSFTDDQNNTLDKLLAEGAI